MNPTCLLGSGSTQLMRNLSLTISSGKSLTAISLVEPLLKLTSTSVSLGNSLV
ncbi:hypothetical protein Dimus_036840 [Dionaea muscipula]